MPVRKANAVWEGGLKDGHGTVKLGSGAFEGRYSFGSRFEEAGGTNPEELIGAAHAGCFSMALSAGLGRAGFTPTRVATTAKVHLEKVGEGFKITRIELGALLLGALAPLLRGQPLGSGPSALLTERRSVRILALPHCRRR